MSRLKKEEIIRLYKIPISMDSKAIWKYSDFFTSITTINKYIKEGRKQGIITPEDDMVFEQRKKEMQEKADKAKSILYKQALKKLLELKSQEQIAKEIDQEFHIKISPPSIAKMHQLAIKNGALSQARYERIKKLIMSNAMIESSKKRKEIQSKQEQEL